MRAQTLTDGESGFCQALFVLIGICSMYYWNAVLNVLYSVVIVRSPNSVVTVTNVYTSVSVVCAFLLSAFGAADKRYFFAGGCLLASMCVLFPICALYFPPHTASVLLHVASAVAGAGEMLYQCSGFSFAVLLCKRYAGYISFGYGACGVLTFAIWMTLSQAIWNRTDPDNSSAWVESDMRKAVWTQFVIGMLLISASLVGVSYLSRLPQMQRAIELAQEGQLGYVEKHVEVPLSSVRENDGISLKLSQQLDGSAKTDDLLIQPRPEPADQPQTWTEQAAELWTVFRSTWQMQIGLGLCVGLSMMAYPLIGPYQFGLTPRRNDILTGIFQCGDFIGRYIPNLAPCLPCLLLPAGWILPLTLARVALLVMFIETARAVAKQAFTNILTHYSTQVVMMAALALSHGYYASVFMIRMTESLANPRHKVKASAMAVCLLVACIAVGMWLARLVHF